MQFSCYGFVISAKPMGPYLKNATEQILKIYMVTVKGPGNKAHVELLRHSQRQLIYGASNWANNAISPVTVLSYLLHLWVHIFKMLQ